MCPSKLSYFQGGGGVNEPTPKRKKYKSEPAIPVQTRFEEPLYKNYDLYDLGTGPGAGWHIMQNFKSIKEFLDHKKKNKKKKQIKARLKLLSRICKIAIDFPTDTVDYEIKSDPILTDSESYLNPEELGPTGNPDFSSFPEMPAPGEFESYPASAQIGGILDRYLPQNDLDDKDPSKLNFTQDYVTNDEMNVKNTEIVPNPSTSSGMFGLPDGVDLADEEQPIYDSKNPFSGTTDLGIDIYNEIY